MEQELDPKPRPRQRHYQRKSKQHDSKKGQWTNGNSSSHEHPANSTSPKRQSGSNGRKVYVLKSNSSPVMERVTTTEPSSSFPSIQPKLTLTTELEIVQQVEVNASFVTTREEIRVEINQIEEASSSDDSLDEKINHEELPASEGEESTDEESQEDEEVPSEISVNSPSTPRVSSSARGGKLYLPRIHCHCGNLITADPSSWGTHASSPSHQGYLAAKGISEESDSMLKRCTEIFEEYKAVRTRYSTSAQVTDDQQAFPTLDESTWKYYRSVAPSQHAIDQRRKFPRVLERCLQNIWPEARVHSFGSSVSGVFSESSDIDVCLILPLERLNLTEQDVIRTIQKYFRKNLKIFRIAAVTNARVPIFKSLEPNRHFYYPFDLNVNRELGVHNSRLICAYFELDERVRPLAHILKDWAKATKLHNSSSAFTSYCLYLLLIFYLQTLPEPVLPNLQQKRDEEPFFVNQYNCSFTRNCVWQSTNTSSVGKLLIGFFKFFFNFQFNKYVISVRAGAPLLRNEAPYKHGSPMAVEDPFELNFNCARLVHRNTLHRMLHESEIALVKLFETQNVFSLFKKK